MLRESGEKSLSYLVLDTTDNTVVCAGEEEAILNASAHAQRRRAMRNGLSHAAVVADTGETIEVYDHNIPKSSLIMGRLPTDIQGLINRKDLAVTFSSTQEEVKDVVLGLSRMSRQQNGFTTAVSEEDYEVSNPVSIYADGSYRDHSDGATAIGYAIIDNSESLIGLGSHSIPTTISSLEAEYQAVRAGVNKAVKYDDITSINLYSDNSRVANVLNGTQDALDRNTTVTEDIKDTLAQFAAVTVEHTPRSNNLLADSLADYGHTETLVGAL